MSKWVIIASRTRWPATSTCERTAICFLSGGQEDEQANEHEHEILAHQAADHKQHGHALAHLGRHLGGLAKLHARGEQRTQDAASVHRKGRQQVEHHQDDVDDHDRLQDGDFAFFELLQPGHRAGQFEHREQDRAR